MDVIDRFYSGMFQELSLQWLEVILFVPAHYFYRTYGAAQSVILSSVIGALRYNEMLANLNYKKIEAELTVLE